MLGTVLGTGESRRNKNTDTTPAVRRILNAWGRESYHKKLYSYQLVILAVEMGRKRSVERFMELRASSYGMWLREVQDALPKKGPWKQDLNNKRINQVLRVGKQVQIPHGEREPGRSEGVKEGL